jgi:hypothetical protein
MPNIRRAVELGDYIFVVSGKVSTVQQYVIGGMRVAEKINALAAYRRLPENRLHRNADGDIWGNIIVNRQGLQHPLDHHPAARFEERVKNFIIGADPVVLENEREVTLGRSQSLDKLSSVLGKRGNRVIDVISRWSKLSESQVEELLAWLQGIKAVAAKS